MANQKQEGEKMNTGNSIANGNLDKDLDRFYGIEHPHTCNNNGLLGCCTICGSYTDPEDRD